MVALTNALIDECFAAQDLEAFRQLREIRAESAVTPGSEEPLPPDLSA